MFVTFVPPRQLAILASVLLLRDEDLHEPVELAREGDVVLPSDVVLQRVLPAVHVAAEGTTELNLESGSDFIGIKSLFNQSFYFEHMIARVRECPWV